MLSRLFYDFFRFMEGSQFFNRNINLFAIMKIGIEYISFFNNEFF